MGRYQSELTATRELQEPRIVASSTSSTVSPDELLRTAPAGGAMTSIIDRCAGLDVHKATVMATVRLPDEVGGRRCNTQAFGTTTASLLTLRDWLQAHGVTHVA